MGVSICQNLATAWAETLCLLAIKCPHLEGFVLSLSLCWVKISWGLSKMSMDMCCFKVALKLEFFSGIWQYGNRDFQHSDIGLKCLYLGLS